MAECIFGISFFAERDFCVLRFYFERHDSPLSGFEMSVSLKKSESSCVKICQFCLPTSVHGRLVCSFYVWGALLVSYKLVSCFDTTRAEF